MSFIELSLRKRLLFLLFVVVGLSGLTLKAETVGGGPSVNMSVTNVSVAEVLSVIAEQTGEQFSYESSVIDNLPRIAFRAENESFESCMNRLCALVGLEWKRVGRIVVLKKKVRNFVVSGYVVDEGSETLLSATVYDWQNKAGTVTNNFGFYSVRLPEGKVSMSASYVGYNELKKDFYLNKDTVVTFVLRPNTVLSEVIVSADSINSPLRTTQLGNVTLSQSDILSVTSVLSSPDLIRRLQQLPGVAAGTELVAGMYVRGGNSDENLYLIDGNPLYQINHLGGLFSAFNIDAIKTVDFFKGGFPARYGGRLSSVVDVRTKDGNMKEYHGNFSIGLLEGRLQFEGPIVKDRTSFNVALRRSWLDVLTVPGFAIFNTCNKNNRINFRYAFHDLNAKVTHRFSENNKLSMSLYSGYDVLKNSSYVKEEMSSDYDKINLGWGNLVASLNWNYAFHPTLYGDISAVYSQFKTKVGDEYREKYYDSKTGEWNTKSISEAENQTLIRDAGYRANFDWRPSSRNHIRFGSDFLFHIFKPQRNMSYEFVKGGEGEKDKELRRNAKVPSVQAQEFSLYAEDDIDILDWWKLNLGVRGTIFHVEDKNYWSVEPRVSTRFTLMPGKLSFKAAYTEMSQYVHMLSTTYLSLPTDMWVPVTNRVKPMRSRQVAAGFYFNLPWKLEAEVEGYYKTSDNVIENHNMPRLVADYSTWEDNVISGKGRSYGVELALRRTVGKTRGEASYTLSWTDRKFDEFWDGAWFPARFDNRHRFNISVAHRFNKKLELFAAWVYATGNRVTVALENYETQNSHNGSVSSTEGFYEYPNNIKLPAYHRLDLGLNIYKKTKRGHEGIWNISLYNAYCRFNPLRVTVYDPDSYYFENGEMVKKPFKVRSEGIIPIIPSFSYTLKF